VCIEAGYAFDLPPEKESSVNVRLRVEKGGQMVRKGYTAEQIINKIREAEILLNQGATVGEASRKIGVTEQTYYRWRKEYGGMRVEQAKRLKDLGKENSRLKKLVADLSLDNAILKEVAEGNF
jgi:transposase-like protein